jgi:hypothetical protein
VPTLPMFHPSFVLRTPERQKEVDIDLQTLQERLRALAGSAVETTQTAE